DNLGHRDAVAMALDTLGPLLERPGAFVLGSNDYWAPTPKNPVRYLLPDRGKRHLGTRLPTAELVSGLRAAGWVDLDNARARVEVNGLTLHLVGVDDPH